MDVYMRNRLSYFVPFILMTIFFVLAMTISTWFLIPFGIGSWIMGRIAYGKHLIPIIGDAGMVFIGWFPLAFMAPFVLVMDTKPPLNLAQSLRGEKRPEKIYAG